MGLEQGKKGEYGIDSLLAIRTVREWFRKQLSEKREITPDDVIKFLSGKEEEYRERKGFGHNWATVSWARDWLTEVENQPEELTKRVNQILQRPEIQPEKVQKRGGFFSRVFKK